MPDHNSAMLGAYLDGELDTRARNGVQTHLKTCPACQAELEELRRVSSLLRASPSPEFTPAREFRNQLMLRLPRRTPAPHSSGSLLPWLAPALVLASWVFVQVSLLLSGLVSLAGQAGVLDDALAWAAGSPQQLVWVSAARAVTGGMLGLGANTGLEAINGAGLFAQNLVLLLVLQVGVAVFYWGAIALVWHYQVRPLWAPIQSN